MPLGRMNRFSSAYAEFGGVMPPRKGREGMEVCSGQCRERAATPLEEGWGQCPLCKGQGNLLPVGSGRWLLLCHGICCLWKPGEGDQDSTAGFGWMNHENASHVMLDLQSVSSWPGPLASPQGSECTENIKGILASSSETLHISDPMSPLTC